MSEKDTKSDDVFGPDVLQALRNVLDYMEDGSLDHVLIDEGEEDYKSNPPSGHVYESIKLLRETLAKLRGVKE